ncbi:MAG: hypothetical protein JWQ27_1182 [Ferruginibacter sp.]|nr:hypothetical protein [Ferruginibacter sp.]
MQTSVFQKMSLTLTMILFGIIAFAQDSTVTATTNATTTTTSEQTWYMQPWAWIVGGAVLILLIIALVRGNSDKTTNSDRVTVTKTVSRDTDV